MSQSGFIAAMLLAAFVLWLAINDRLTTYTAVLFGPTQQPTPQGNISNKGGIIAPVAVTSGGAAAGASPALPDMSGSGDSAGILDTVIAEAPLLLEFL